MTALVWDQVGDRRFETGVDHGVLYLSDSAVPWNGIASVTEILGREVKSYYNDGIKYLDHKVLGTFSATLQAYTYPEELDDLVGVEPFAPGAFIHDQRSKTFSLSYRTRVGNDLDGTDHGYKLHLLYNIMANPSSAQYSSLGAKVNAQLFEWTLTAVPSQIYGIRPTSQISLDSRLMDPELLESIEAIIYGDDETEPSLPSFVDLLGLIEEFYA